MAFYFTMEQIEGFRREGYIVTVDGSYDVFGTPALYACQIEAPPPPTELDELIDLMPPIPPIPNSNPEV